MFLQRMQDTRAADSLRRRPNQHERVSGPRILRGAHLETRRKDQQSVCHFAKPKPPRLIRRTFRNFPETAASIAARSSSAPKCIFKVVRRVLKATERRGADSALQQQLFQFGKPLFEQAQRALDRGSVSSCPRLRLSTSPAEISSRPTAKNSDMPHSFLVRRRARAAKAPPRRKSLSRICKHRMHDRNAESAGIPDQARDRCIKFSAK